ncbi:MAG: glycoside hydrolase family 43 protein [Lachnotalea sp.]
MKKTKIIFYIITITLITILSSCAKVNEKSIEDIATGNAKMKVSVHDPQVIVAEDGSYYMFGTHMTAAKANSLTDWSMFATGVGARNKLFDNLFDEEKEAFAYVGKNEDGRYSVWAPDVIYNKATGKYMMYFCTTSTYVKSNLCFATADSVEGPYTYQNTILYSGFTSSTVKKTNFYDIMPEDTKITAYVKNGSYNNLEWPNCIDPALFYDKNGKLWMVYGSWSGGIFLLQIDEETGYPIHPEANPDSGVDTYFGKKLAGGGHNSIEGPYIQYDEDTRYYYLIVSYGVLTSDGGYQIRQFRSKTVDGTYLDAKGQTLDTVVDHSDYGVKMMGNYTLPSLDCTYMAPGGQSTFTDSEGKMYLVYHQRFKDGTESHEPRIHQLFSTSDGWLVATPFASNGESLKENGYQSKDVTGTYYILNHGTDISSNENLGKETTFSSGAIKGEYEGSYQVKKGSSDISITIDGVIYKGILIDMTDEAGNPVRCFSAVGDNNQTIWGVHYLENAEDESIN